MGVAAGPMGVSQRHVWRLLAAYSRERASAMAHGNRGRKPSTTTDTGTKQRVRNQLRVGQRRPDRRVPLPAGEVVDRNTLNQYVTRRPTTPATESDRQSARFQPRLRVNSKNSHCRYSPTLCVRVNIKLIGRTITLEGANAVSLSQS